MKKYSLKPAEAIFVLLLGLPNFLVWISTFLVWYKKYKSAQRFWKPLVWEKEN